MSISKLQIWNMGLSHLGMPKIFSTDLDNPSAIACDLYWLPALDDAFSELSWAFATVKEQFALVSETVVGWDYVYAYPPKAAGVHNVFSEANVMYKEEQEFETVFLPSSNKKVICSNEPEAWQEYTYVVLDTTIYSPKFVIAASFKLAALMAQSLTSDPGAGGAMQQNAGIIVSEAKRINAKEKIKRAQQTNPIVEAR